MAVICTLFEGSYSKGLGGLLNSLVKAGYAGHVYAGYRGQLPPWFTEDVSTKSPFPNTKVFALENIHVHFILLQTDFHFTNYKPFFLAEVISVLGDVGQLVYFDPDIVLKCKWDFIEQWTRAGVAVVHEIVNNQMPSNHPRRIAWIKSTDEVGCTVVNESNHYINAGFIGVSSCCFGLIDLWKKLILYAIDHHSFNKSTMVQSKDPNGLWHIGDQDLLNLSLMYSSCPISAMGPEAMDFIHGGRVMSHCTGSPKPWDVNFMLQLLKGISPSMPSKEYWKYASEPIKVFSYSVSYRKNLVLKICSFLSRFYKR